MLRRVHLLTTLAAAGVLAHSAATLDHATFAASLEAPEERPQRAANWDFEADLHARLQVLIDEHPDWITPFVIGESVQGRPLWAYRVRHPHLEPSRKLLVISQLHALEWIGPEVAVAFLETLLGRAPAGVDQALGAPWPEVEIVVVPIVNPDGRHRVEQDLVAGRTRTYRRGNGNLVDLNRDWAVHREATAVWQHVVPKYYVTSPGPLSQPESRAVDDLAHDERFDAFVSLHAFGRYVFVPWSGRWARPEDWDTLHDLAHTMRAAQEHPYTVRQLSRYVFFFRAQGSEIDHLYGEHGALSFLIELTPSGIRPLKPTTWRDVFRWYSPEDPTEDVADGVNALLALTLALPAAVPHP